MPMPLKTTEVPAQSLRREAAELLGRIQYQRERVVITKHGKPIVAMVPIEDLALIEFGLKKSKGQVYLVDELAPTPSQIANYAAVQETISGHRKVKVHSVSIKEFPKSMRPKKRKSN